MSTKTTKENLLPAEYEQWITQYKTVYTLKCIDADGVERVMYIRKPNYDLKKQCVLLLMKSQDNVITTGEMIIAACYLGGYNMNEDEDLRLEAAIQAANMVEMNDSMQLKKS